MGLFIFYRRKPLLIVIGLTSILLCTYYIYKLLEPYDRQKYIKNYYTTNILNDVYIREVFRTKDDELVFFMYKDIRNNIKLQAKIGETVYNVKYSDYEGGEELLPQAKCSFQEYYAKVKVHSPHDLNNGYITLKIKGYQLDHSVKITDVRNNGTYEHELGVVLPTTFYLADWQNLIQFFESWLAHGATKFYVYYHSWTKQVDVVINFYKNLLGNNLEIIHYSAVPVRKDYWGKITKDPNTRIYEHMTPASLNNGLYRAKGSVRFLALMDLDEILFVEENVSLIDLLHKLMKEYPTAAQFVFHWLHLSSVLELSGLNKPSEINFNYLDSVKMINKGAIDDFYFNLTGKLIHRTDRVETTEIHFKRRNTYMMNTDYEYKTIVVDPWRASTAHIRRIFNQAHPDTKKVKSNVMANLASKMDELYSQRIANTSFSEHDMSPWYPLYYMNLLIMNGCRRVLFHHHKDTGGLSECYSTRGCEQFLAEQGHYLFARNAWTNLAVPFSILEDVFN